MEIYKNIFCFFLVFLLNEVKTDFNPYQILGVAPFNSMEHIQERHDTLIKELEDQVKIKKRSNITVTKKINEIRESLAEIKELQLIQDNPPVYSVGIKSLYRVMYLIITESLIYILGLYAIYQICYFGLKFLDFFYYYICKVFLSYFVLENLASNIISNQQQQIIASFILPFLYRYGKKYYFRYVEGREIDEKITDDYSSSDSEDQSSKKKKVKGKKNKEEVM